MLQLWHQQEMMRSSSSQDWKNVVRFWSRACFWFSIFVSFLCAVSAWFMASPKGFKVKSCLQKLPYIFITYRCRSHVCVFHAHLKIMLPLLVQFQTDSNLRKRWWINAWKWRDWNKKYNGGGGENEWVKTKWEYGDEYYVEKHVEKGKAMISFYFSPVSKGKANIPDMGKEGRRIKTSGLTN